MHTISSKILSIDKDGVTVTLSGRTDLAHGFAASVVELAQSIPYLIENGFSQSISDAGAAPKGTPDADKRAARKARFEALVNPETGYTGGSGRERHPLWVRLTVDKIFGLGIVPEGVKRADVTAAVYRDDGFGNLPERIASGKGLNVAKVAAKMASTVEWAKKEAARRAKADAADIDLDDLK